MKPYQYKFISLVLNKQVLKFGEFILKSGRKSPYFFNTGLFNTGHDLALLGKFYATTLIDSGINFDLLFGPAYKGIPIVITTAIALAKHYERNVPYCFNRKEIKDHGEGGNLIGSILQGQVILVDDVITTGNTILESIKTIEAYGATLVGVLISLNRQEHGQIAVPIIQNMYSRCNCKIISIITIEDIISYIKEIPEMTKHLVAIQAYQKKFGI